MAAFFSREDLTVGLVGQDVDGIFGYTPESATSLMRNVVLYAAGREPVAAAGDAPQAAAPPGDDVGDAVGTAGARR